MPVRVMPAPRDAPRTPNLLSNTLPSPPPISTNMAPIDDAVIAFEARSLREQSILKDYALHFGVCRSTLGRRLKRQTASAEAKATSQLKLHPHHETALVQYIEDLTKRGLAPTRTMIRTFASEIAPTPVLESWVTRFLERNSD
jgi:hypothetical protein